MKNTYSYSIYIRGTTLDRGTISRNGGEGLAFSMQFSKLLAFHGLHEKVSQFSRGSVPESFPFMTRKDIYLIFSDNSYVYLA